MKQINKNNVKKVLAAAGKFVGQKAAPAIGGLGMLFNTSPLAAQPVPKPAGQKLVLGVELSFTCVNVQPYNGLDVPCTDRTLDLDGDIRTANDQVHHIISNSTLRKFPQIVMKIGDEVVCVLTNQDIKTRLSGEILSLNGRVYGE